jgi:hypothetical protein
LSPQQASTRTATRQKSSAAASMQRPSFTSSPQAIGFVTWPSLKPQQNWLPTEPCCFPAQSPGQVTQFSPSPASQRPLPQSAPLTSAQSAGQFKQSSPGSQTPFSTQFSGSFAAWNWRIIS